MQQNLQQKKGLVKSVFDTVYNKYDLMNDFMSFGVHRYWKKELIRQINPSSNDTLVDVACGTGDIARLFSDVNYNYNRLYLYELFLGIALKHLMYNFTSKRSFKINKFFLNASKQDFTINDLLILLKD